eukprot:750922-Hanusia_phi.AAC.1
MQGDLQRLPLKNDGGPGGDAGAERRSGGVHAGQPSSRQAHETHQLLLDVPAAAMDMPPALVEEEYDAE